MKGLTTLIAAGVAALALAPPATASSATASADRCKVKGSKTILRNSQARLYTKRGVWSGCLRKNGRKTKLATATGGCNDEVTSVTKSGLSGPFVVLATRFEGCTEGIFDSILRRDLRGGRAAHIETPVLGFPDNRQFQEITVSAVAASASGAIAWIATADADTVGQVVVLPANTRTPKMLDSFNAADPKVRQLGSLRITGSTVSWTNGGVQKSAPIP